MDKRRQALVVICLGVFISLTYLLAVYYQQRTCMVEYKLWDVDTVTVADFTVETTITDTQWRTFLELDEIKSLPAHERIRHLEKLLRKEVTEMVK